MYKDCGLYHLSLVFYLWSERRPVPGHNETGFTARTLPLSHNHPHKPAPLLRHTANEDGGGPTASA